ncbi:MAG TPA: recombination mediator RecR [Bacilli bacterium]|nr:recombination mediator RecR [Bacilli bacterium]
MYELATLDKLIEHLKRLPGVGQKTAERMAYAFLNMEHDVLEDFGITISKLRDNIKTCEKCGLYTEKELCSFCADKTRTSDTLIIVSYAKDIQGFIKLEDFNGRFHILNGVLSPAQNLDSAKLDLGKLEKRIASENVKELIIATNPNVEGELTALYIARKLSDTPVEITRLGYGLPMGGQVDYVDTMTLFKALEGRRNIK